MRTTLEQIEATLQKYQINLEPLFNRMTEQEFNEFSAICSNYLASIQKGDDFSTKLGYYFGNLKWAADCNDTPRMILTVMRKTFIEVS